MSKWLDALVKIGIALKILEGIKRKKNIVKELDGERMKKLRLEKEGTIKEYSKQLGISHVRLASIESDVSKPLNWKEYLKFKKFYKDELLKESSVKKKNAKVVTKEFITFKNVGGRWEMGKLIKQEVV